MESTNSKAVSLLSTKNLTGSYASVSVSSQNTGHGNSAIKIVSLKSLQPASVSLSSINTKGPSSHVLPGKFSIGQLRPAFSYTPDRSLFQKQSPSACNQFSTRAVVIRTLPRTSLNVPNSSMVNQSTSVIRPKVPSSSSSSVMLVKNSSQVNKNSILQSNFKPVGSNTTTVQHGNNLQLTTNVRPDKMKPVITVRQVPSADNTLVGVIPDKMQSIITKKTVTIPVQNNEYTGSNVNVFTTGSNSFANKEKCVSISILDAADSLPEIISRPNLEVDIEDIDVLATVGAEEIVIDDNMSVNTMLDNINSATTFIQNSIRPNSKSESLQPVKSNEPKLSSSTSLLSGDRRNIIVVSGENSVDGSKSGNGSDSEDAKRRAALRPVLTFEGINDILDNVSFSHLTGSQMKCITYASCTMGHQVPPGLLLDVDTVDGIVLEEAALDIKTWHPRVLFSDSFVLNGDQLLDENRFKVIPFQINSNKLKRDMHSKFSLRGEKRLASNAGFAEVVAKKRREENSISAKNGVDEVTDKAKSTNSDVEKQNVALSDNEHNAVVDKKNDDIFYGCYMCNFTGEDENDVVKHWIKEHIPEKPYVCCYCFAVFSQSYKAQLHIEKFHAGREVAIALKPSKVFTTQMVVTTDAADPELPIIPFDGNTTKVPTLLLDGETELPSIDGGFKCKKCEFTCSSAFDLKKHLRQEHSCLRPYVCYVCGRRFSCSFDVRRHVEQFHTSKSKKRKPAVDPSIESTRLESVLIDNKNPTLTQKAAWNVFLEKPGLAFFCKFCDFRTSDKAVIWSHAMQKHSWPTSIRCSQCKATVDVNEKHRSQKWVNCLHCNTSITIGPSATNSIFPAGKNRKSRTPDNSGRVYVCKVCDYKTNDKSGMTRHIKYNHTACRPYSCPYCNYSAVERPKVRVHVAGHHRGLPITVIKRLEVIKQFQATIATLYKKLTFVLDGSSQEMMELYEGDGNLGEEGAISYDDREIMETQIDEDIGANNLNMSLTEPCSLGKRASHKRIEAYNAQWRGGPSMLHIDFNMTPDGRLQCEECDYTTNQWTNLARHMRLEHKELYANGYRQKTKGKKAFRCEHFRCTLCEYRCLDRSCMARHVKYLHMSERPHKCPHCEYSNVEKTKVRMHIRTMHSGKNPYVRTNREMLSWMSDEVRKYFLRVDKNGVEIAESTSADLNSPGGSDTEDASVSDSVKAEDGSCQVVDQPGNGKEVDKRRRHAVPEYMVLNVHNTQQSAELAIKDNMVKVDLSNYFKKEPEDASYDQAMVRNESMPAVVHIKDEPIDDEYEKSAASGSFVKDRRQSFTHFQIANGTVMQVDSNTSCGHEKFSFAKDDLQMDEWELAEVKLEDEDNDEWIAYEYDEDEIMTATDSNFHEKVADFSDNVLYDPKLHMMPVVEVEDVVKNIIQSKAS